MIVFNMPMGMKPWFYDGIINRFETLFALKRRRLRIEEDFFSKQLGTNARQPCFKYPHARHDA